MSVELKDITSGYSTGLINDNFQLVEDELNNNVLRRDGLSSGEANQMEVGLDMNSNFVYNLPEPVLQHQAARLQDVQNAIAGDTQANLIEYSPTSPYTEDTVQGAIESVQFVDTPTGSDQPLETALNSREIWVADLAGLKSLDVSSLLANAASRMTTTGRAGNFRWVTGDQSSNVTADPQEGVWIAPSSDATGASGAWERVYDKSIGGNVEWFGVLGDGSTETTAVQAAIDFGFLDLNLSNIDVTSDSLVITSPLRIKANNASITSADSTNDHLIKIQSSTVELKGLHLVGNQANNTSGFGVSVQNALSGIKIDGCEIEDFASDGIRFEGIEANPISDYIIKNNNIHDNTGIAIHLVFSNDGQVYDNKIDTAQHGIQWWGGDSATADVHGIRDIAISGNIVRNTTGGIWGSLGEFITITGNIVEECSDVGIDPEGSRHVTVTSNHVRNCTNAGLSCFYGCENITFTGNSVRQQGGYGPCVKMFTSETNTWITLSGNIFDQVAVATCIATDDSSVRNIDLSGNTFRIFSNSRAIEMSPGCGMGIISNNIFDYDDSVDTTTAIWLRGAEEFTVSGNRFEAPAATNTADVAGAIRLTWVDASNQSTRHTVSGNFIRGFHNSIVDDPSGDVTHSRNLILWNRCERIKRRTGASYTGRIESNVSIDNPNTGISAVTF